MSDFIFYKRISAYPKNSGKSITTVATLTDFHQKMIDINLRYDYTNYTISKNSVDPFLSNTCHDIFITHTKTHRQKIFQKLPNRVQDVSKYVNP